jgi:glycosyltransferase involved in cell wall biosynthesis
MRILHVRASNFFGGPEKQILGQAKVGSNRGLETHVASFCEKGRETELVARARRSGLEAHSIRCSNAYDPGQILRLRGLLRRLRPELVCTHDYRSTALSWVALRGAGVPQIAFWRGVTREDLKVTFYYWLERRFLNAVDHVVAVSEEQRSWLAEKRVPRDRVSLVPNAVDIACDKSSARTEVSARSDCSGADHAVTGPSGTSTGSARRLASVIGETEGRVLIATAGRLSPEKGQNFLLEAMPKMIASRSDVMLLMFGEGPKGKRLRAAASELGCAQHVRFPGFVDDFASLARDVDVFVLPSLAEGLPNVLLEAMAASRPVVATKVGGIVDLLVDGQNGLLVPPADSDALASAILRLLSDRELAARLGRCAQETVRDSYSFARQFELLEEIYRRVIGDKRRAE